MMFAQKVFALAAFPAADAIKVQWGTTKQAPEQKSPPMAVAPEREGTYVNLVDSVLPKGRHGKDDRQYVIEFENIPTVGDATCTVQYKKHLKSLDKDLKDLRIPHLSSGQDASAVARLMDRDLTQPVQRWLRHFDSPAGSKLLYDHLDNQGLCGNLPISKTLKVAVLNSQGHASYRGDQSSMIKQVIDGKRYRFEILKLTPGKRTREQRKTDSYSLYHDADAAIVLNDADGKADLALKAYSQSCVHAGSGKKAIVARVTLDQLPTKMSMLADVLKPAFRDILVQAGETSCH